eukprot:TRINITY_DN14338_c0_g1_i1.p1 TRINITY_DN14338_c0_g1~~TRINITY_DN14338_c0_g1_i1.p1  ORF type:complete len:190 (+),score=49.91 TRINITY_DN14338_c0_g1_i1:127-696(+)
MAPFRVVVIGEGGVGKSCLTIQFINEKFVEEYDPTLEDSYRKQLTVDDDEHVLDIFDTAGQEDFCAVRDQYMRTGEGFLCVYSICAEATFRKVKELYDHVLRVKDTESVAFILVGNKADMEKLRQVPTEEGAALARSLNVPFFETSAKTGLNVSEIFVQSIREITKWRSLHQPAAETPIRKKKGGCVLL